ncbi:MAG: LON peptidase substrate-binding domain-containing protein [Magnetococcales bacterium]|nr:LON peptidase substrate-binding domain-containing protein [Magnetococcales bacterium]
MKENILEIPIFPLHLKFMPGDRVPLRIFEPRYLDMVKKVAGKKEGFGIVQITEGGDVGPTPEIKPCGTLATIVDFDTLENKLLGITVLGERQFKIRNTWVEGSGLMMGSVKVADIGDEKINLQTDSENAGPLDIKIAKQLGIPTREYVNALLKKQIKTEHLEPGEIIDGEKLTKTRVIFRYQGRSTYIDIEEK